MTTKQKERTKNLLGRHLAGAYWRWNGSHFTTCQIESADVSGNRIRIHVYFTAKMNFLTVSISLMEKYGISDKEETFIGENAIEEALTWEVERLYEAVEEIGKRTAPYAQGYENYLLALRGETLEGEE